MLFDSIFDLDIGRVIVRLWIAFITVLHKDRNSQGHGLKYPWLMICFSYSSAFHCAFFLSGVK